MAPSCTTLAWAVSLLLAQATAQSCYSGVNIFTARGSFEQGGTYGRSSIYISAIEDAIPGSGATIIDYPADYSATSVPIGVYNGNTAIEEYLDACPDSQIVLMGYSQGAIVQGYVLTGANFTYGPDGSTPYNAPPLAEKYVDQLAAIVFFGDPQYNAAVGENPIEPYPCPGNSYAPRTDSHWVDLGSRIQEYCDDTDNFCCSGASGYGHTAYFNSGNATIAATFVSERYSLASVGGSSSSSSSSTTTITPMPPTSTISLPSSKTGSFSSGLSMMTAVSAWASSFSPSLSARR